MLVSLKIAQIHLRQPALHRQHGERVIYAKTGIIRPLVIPMYKKSLCSLSRTSSARPEWPANDFLSFS
jgi:hypothetical protein